MDPKNAARDYLLAAEKYIKESLFDEARREVKKAQELDPSNVYTFAFLERIEFFRQQKAKESGAISPDVPNNGLPDDETPADDVTDMQESQPTDAPENDSVQFDDVNQPDETDKDEPEDIEAVSEVGEAEIPEEDPSEEPAIEEERTHHEKAEEDIPPPDSAVNDDELDIQVEFDKYSGADSVKEDEQDKDIDDQEETIDEEYQEDDTIDQQTPETNKYDFDLNDLRGDTIREDDIQPETEPSGQTGEEQPPEKTDGELPEQNDTDHIDKQDQIDVPHIDNEKIGELEKQLHSLNERIDSLHETLTAQKGDDPAAGLEEKLKMLEEQLNKLQSSPDETTAKQTEKYTDSKIDDIERRLNDLSVAIQAELAGGKDFEKIESQLNNLQSKVETIASSFTTDDELNKRHGEIYTKLETIEQRLLTYEQTANRDAGDSKTLENDLESIRARLDEIDNTARQNLENPDLDNKFEVLSRRIDALQESLRSSEIIENKTDEVHAQLFEIENKLQNLDDALQNMDELKRQLGELQAQTEHIQALPKHVDDLSKTQNNLLEKYADLDMRLQKALSSENLKQITSEEMAEFNAMFEELRKRVEEISGSTSQNQELINTRSEILSRCNDLEQRIDGLITKQNQQREDLNGWLASRQSETDNKIAGLYEKLNSVQQALDAARESRIDKGEIDSRFDRVESTVEKLLREIDHEKGARKKVSEVLDAVDTIYKQIEEILETLQFEKEFRTKQNELDGKISGIAQKVDSLAKTVEESYMGQDTYAELEQKIIALKQKFENELHAYTRKLNETGENIEIIKRTIDSDKEEREESHKRQIEIGMKHFRSEVEKAWQDGAPRGKKADELKDLSDSLSIPEPVEKQIIRDVKLHMYGRAVKKAIAEKKVSRKEALSLDKLRKQYDISLDEYMEYESKFLHDLVSTQFQGTVLLVSADETSRNNLSEQLKSVGFAVVNASSPDTALEKLEIINPHVIISELNFPEIENNGLTMLDAVRRNVRFNYIPFIILADQENYNRIESTLTNPNEQAVEQTVEFHQLLNTINEQLKKLRDHLSSQTL